MSSRKGRGGGGKAAAKTEPKPEATASIREPGKPISLEDGWDFEIKPKAIDKLTELLDSGVGSGGGVGGSAVKREPGAVKPTKRLFDAREYMHVYTMCYDMCTQRTPYNWSEQLYQRHGETFVKYLSGTVLPALTQQDKHGEFLLKELVRRWGNQKIMNAWMQKFFMYLDRYYVRHHSLPTLHEAGLKHFKVIVYDVVRKDVAAAMLAVIDKEREGAIVDRTLIASCVELFESMGMGTLDAYTSDLEEPLLQSTREYYQRKAEQWIGTDSTPDYMIKAENALESEKQRVGNYLNHATEMKLLRVCEEEMLEKRETELLEKEGSGCRVLLQNDKSEDLSRMFRLFSRIPSGLLPMAAIVKEHISAMGNDVITRREAKVEGGDKDTNQDPTFVKELLALHDKYMAVVNEQFGGNSLLQKALKEAFVEFVNRDVGKFKNADLMSSFCDRVLKTGGEKLSDEEVEEYLTKVVQLFSYLTDKDLFAEIYRNQLAKRLLNQRSASDDMERAMIGKLKLRCGAQFTGKMEGMMNDLAIGVDHHSDFVSYIKQQADEGKPKDLGGVDFSVQVLTTGYWPTYKAMDVTLPPAMLKCTNVFREYYTDVKTSHRRLAWMHGLGNVTVRGSFGAGGSKSYDLQVTTLQACALMLFAASSKSSMGFEEVVTALNLPEEIVKRTMHSLSCGKYKVLKRSSADGTSGSSGSIRNDDSFAYNKDFSCPMRKVRIPMASLEENHNPKRVEEDRGIAIEAAIVRILKARKTIEHQQLVAEVLSQLSFFRPQPKVIKRKIEVLIEREYVERDPDAANTYRYLA